jgi:hypothetical protein
MLGKKINEELKDAAPIPAEEIPRLFKMLLECKKEDELTKREMKKFDSMKEVMIREITGKYNFYEFLFSKIFAERQEIIKKDFEIIDNGMKQNNRELVAAGLAGLSQVVASSPFTDLEKIKRMLGQ